MLKLKGTLKIELLPFQNSEVINIISKKGMTKIRGRPFKTSAVPRGVGVNPLPTFADMRGVGVFRKSTSAIFYHFQ